MKHVAIPAGTFAELINYLAKQPFVEVNGLISKLQREGKTVEFSPPADPPADTSKDA